MIGKRTKDDDPLAAIKDFVRAGKLGDIREWIQAGKALSYPAEAKRRSVLEVAAQTGFYAIVEELLKVWTDKDTLNRALDRALKAKHPEVAKLLIEHGADVNVPWPSSFAECFNPDLMRFFFDRCADMGTSDVLAEVIIERPRPLIGVFKEYGQKLPNGKVQLAKALKHFVRDKDLKWVSLCVWMGADPRLAVHDMDYDCEETSSAIDDAFFEPTPEMLKALRFDPKRDNINQFMDHIYRFDTAIIDFLMTNGATINSKPNGGCALLDKCFWQLYSNARHDGIFRSDSPGEREVRHLIDLGAKLVPNDSSDFRNIRLAICGQSPTFRADFLKLVSRAASLETMQKILSTPYVERELGISSKRLMEKLGLYPSGKAGPGKAVAPPGRPKVAEPKQAIRSETMIDSPPSQSPDSPSSPAPGPKPTPSARVEKLLKQRSEILRKEPVTLTRQELYEAIWRQPTRTLASQLGLSDVGLAKICKKYNVPRPTYGYWAKLDRDQKSDQIPLPQPQENPSITIHPHEGPNAIQDSAVRQEVAATLERLGAALPSITVPHRLSNPHPLIQETIDANREAKELQGGWIRRESGKRCINVAVSDEQWQRSLTIMDALFKALEQQGHKVMVGSDDYRGPRTFVEINGTKVEMKLSEHKQGLRLSIEEYATGMRKTWQDSERRRLEDILPKFIEALILIAAKLRERDMERQRRQEELERQRQQREVEIAAYKAEEQRVNKLCTESAAWCKAKQIRDYVEAVRSDLLKKQGNIEPGSDAEKWVAWALQQADRLDPLAESPPSVLDKNPALLQ